MNIDETMVRKICEAIAENSPFSVDDIYAEWELFHSFDVVIRAADFAVTVGIATIREASSRLVEGDRKWRELESELNCPRCGKRKVGGRCINLNCVSFV